LRSRLAAIRQVMAIAAQATERPGVATRARGDGGGDRYRQSRLAAIRQVMARSRPRTNLHGRTPRRRDVGTGRRGSAAWPRSGR
jgi:hypothetical protein